MTEICGQVNMLKHRIKNLLDVMCEAESKNNLRKIEFKKYENEIAECVEYHIAILRYFIFIFIFKLKINLNYFSISR